MRASFRRLREIMPELPEVETTRRGIAPHVTGRRIAELRVREPRLRWPVPPELARTLAGKRIEAVRRRAKYLLLDTGGGALILHLGMSGSLRMLDASVPPRPHDHVDIVLEDGRALRLHDPRRFGALLWAPGDPLLHPLLRGLGPEPLGPDFTAGYLHGRAAGRRVAVKGFLMDSRVVVGVGNIYANEALHAAGIHPARAAGRIGRERWARLVDEVRAVLERAIRAGGTTLRDYVDGSGEPGWFAQKLLVYDRAGEPCRTCGSAIRVTTLGQRSTYYCPRCQR